MKFREKIVFLGSNKNKIIFKFLSSIGHKYKRMEKCLAGIQKDYKETREIIIINGLIKRSTR